MKNTLIIIFFLTAFIFPLSQGARAEDQSATNLEVNDRFVIQGNISVANENNFEASGDIVAVPTELADDLNEKGVIKVGNTVRVAGVIKNGIKIAREVSLAAASPTPPKDDKFDRLLNSVKEIINDL